jgi:hypothetical protein
LRRQGKRSIPASPSASDREIGRGQVTQRDPILNRRATLPPEWARSIMGRRSETQRMLRLLFALGFALAALPAQAMQFRLIQSAGEVAVLATGAIGPGDADRLAAALRRATRDRHGTKELLISSVGGVVAEAWAMADVINQVGVTTIVPAGSLCASACASVVFVAGKYRTIQKGGQLAIHSCFDDRNGQKMDDCDALISARAEQEGISGRAMMAFQEMAPGPDSAIVFDPANAACFGLTRAPGKASLGDRAPCIVQAMKAAKRRR